MSPRLGRWAGAPSAGLGDPARPRRMARRRTGMYRSPSRALLVGSRPGALDHRRRLFAFRAVVTLRPIGHDGGVTVTVPKPLAVTIAAGLALVAIGAGASGALSPKQMTNPISLTTNNGPMVNGPEQTPPKLPPSTTTTRPKPRN